MIVQHCPDGCVFPEMRAPHWAWPECPPAEAYVALDDAERPLSILRLFPRKLSSNTVSFHIVGIGGVWTQPEHRGQHHASTLLAYVCEQINRRAIVAAGLYAHADRARMYRRQGFVEVQPRLYLRSLVPGLQFVAGEPAAPYFWWKLEPDVAF